MNKQIMGQALKLCSVIENGPRKLDELLIEYIEDLNNQVRSFSEYDTELFKSLNYSDGGFPNNDNKRKIVEIWGALKEEWERIQLFKGKKAMLYGWSGQFSDSCYLDEWKRKGKIIDFVLPNKEGYPGGPRVIFQSNEKDGPIEIRDYGLGKTLLKGTEIDDERHKLTYLNGKNIFPSRNYQIFLNKVSGMNYLINSSHCSAIVDLRMAR